MKRITPKMIERMDNKEIRRIYSQARSIANKRIDRLTKAGLNKGKQRFPTLKSLDNLKNPAAKIAEQLVNVSRFISTKQTTVRVVRSRVAEGMRFWAEERGYDFIDSPQKLFQFYSFMDDLREQYGNKSFSSADAADVMKQGERLRIPKEKLVKYFADWRDNLDKMESLRPPRGGKEFSQDRIYKTRKRWE